MIKVKVVYEKKPMLSKIVHWLSLKNAGMFFLQEITKLANIEFIQQQSNHIYIQSYIQYNIRTS